MEITITQPDLLHQAQQVFDTLDINESSREGYKKSVKEFIHFISGKNFTSNSFLEFKQYLKKRNSISTSTKNKYLTATRILLKQIHRTALLPTDITCNVKNFKQEKKHKKYGLNQVEIDAVCEKISQMPRTIENMRLRSIVSLLLFQGLRQHEVVGLDVEHLNLKEGLALITGKDRDDQELIDLHPETVRILSEYINENKIVSGPLIFCLSNRNRNGRLTTKSLRRDVTKQFKDLNIFRSSHGFRHYFVTTLIKKFKGNLFSVAQRSRHKSFDMLQVYNDEEHNREALPEYHAAFNGVKMA